MPQVDPRFHKVMHAIGDAQGHDGSSPLGILISELFTIGISNQYKKWPPPSRRKVLKLSYARQDRWFQYSIINGVPGYVAFASLCDACVIAKGWASPWHMGTGKKKRENIFLFFILFYFNQKNIKISNFLEGFFKKVDFFKKNQKHM